MDFLYRSFERIKYGLALLLLIWFIAGNAWDAKSQNASNHNTEKIWSQIESRLNSRPSDTSFNFIKQMVQQECGMDTACLVNTYNILTFKLERVFNLPAAIAVCDELLKISTQQNDLDGQAKTCRNLGRFHSALGNENTAAFFTENAFDLYEKAGNQHAITTMRMSKLEQRLGQQNSKEVISEMDALLKQAIGIGDTLSVKHLNMRLVQIKLDAGLYNQAANHIDYLEKLPVSNPILPEEYGMLITAALGHAKLLIAKKDTKGAEFYLKKALRYCEAEPSRWLEIHVLQLLSELERGRGKTDLAKSYIDKAHTKAENLQLYDLLIDIFMTKAKIAESEASYAEALEYTKKMYSYKDSVDKKRAGFNAQNYYLKKEKEKLAIEKEKQNLELTLKKVALRNSLLITVLIFLLAAGLSIGLYKQRKGKMELAAQNALIKKQSEKLESLDKAKSRFFANVSHELRTPLSLILGPLKTLENEIKPTPKQTKLLGLATQNARLMEELITEILDLTKLDMGKMELDEKPTDLYALFHGYCSHFESLSVQKNIDFSVLISVDENLLVNLDQGKFRQILYNLLINAFKFSLEGDSIRASLTVKEDILQIEVSDTGPGIHPEDLPHLFDRFFQTTRADKPAEGGTGIGLALCHEYARMFGGNIEVKSTLGKGTNVRVTFPVSLVDEKTAAEFRKTNSHDLIEVTSVTELTDKEQTEHFEQNADVTLGYESKPTILVVEDNLDQQEYLDLILAGRYNIIKALNGKDGYDYLTVNHDCKLIISDLMMPVMDGYQLLEKVKSDDCTRHIPFIMLTGRADTGSKLNALRIGVDDYLVKPYDEDELLVRIENLLKNQAARFIATDSETEPEKCTPAFSQEDLQWLNTFEDYIRVHLNIDTLTVPGLADEFAMSESSLLRQLKRLTGLSPSRYLIEMRLDKARELLETRSYSSIARVAYEVGYADARSFSRSFKLRFGKSPSDLLV